MTALSPLAPIRLVYTGDIRKGLEGTHVYKINGYYYLYCTYGGRDGMQVALRSKNIYGPYEQKLLICDTTKGINYGIHQGALIQTQTGEWWTILFVDSGPFGRFPSLQPVTWVDGWPMVGVNGKAVTTYKKPNVGKTYPIKDFPKSDEFNETKLGMQWGWNHNPDADKMVAYKKTWVFKIENSYHHIRFYNGAQYAYSKAFCKTRSNHSNYRNDKNGREQHERWRHGRACRFPGSVRLHCSKARKRKKFYFDGEQWKSH